MATRRGPDGTVRVAIQGTRGNVNWANVFWANLAGGAAAPQANLDTWLTSFANAYKTNLGALQTTDVAYVQAKATLFQTGGTVLQSVSAMTGAGTNGTPGVADNSAALVISWVTSVYWRGGKPRTYLAGPLNTIVLNNHSISSATAASIVTAGNAFRTAVNALSAGAITSTTLGFVSFRSGNVDRVPPLFFSFNGANAHTRIGTQRRRNGKWTL